MSEHARRRPRGRMILAALGFLCAAIAAPCAGQAFEISGLKPLDPQPAKVEAGLKVEYISVFVRHVDDCEIAGRGHDGGLIEALDWANTDGEVLTSGEDNGVCARFRGLFKFPKAGTYTMAMQSNDGVRLLIGEKKIVEDPDVHSDQFSEYASVTVAKAGWYPLYLIYFERKGTSTVELYWQAPGANDFELVPASAYGHIAK